MWVVDAQADGDAGTYTYLVDAPEDANEESVACCAYAKHGQLHREGLVDRLLGPVWFAYWQETVEWEAA